MLIKLVDIGKRYNLGAVAVDALSGVSLGIKEGEAIAIMGPSGSGKSTLLSILGCLDGPTTGSYFLAGQQVAGLSRAQLAEIRSRYLGFVFQTFNLLARTTALENVMLPLVYAGVPARRRREQAAAILEIVGLAERIHHMPNQLSGGQQQRVAIARALVNRPRLLFADEPTGALDLNTGREVLDLLRKINAEGTTLILVTHDHVVADSMQRIIMLSDGRLCERDHTQDGRVRKQEARHLRLAAMS